MRFSLARDLGMRESRESEKEASPRKDLGPSAREVPLPRVGGPRRRGRGVGARPALGRPKISFSQNSRVGGVGTSPGPDECRRDGWGEQRGGGWCTRNRLGGKVCMGGHRGIVCCSTAACQAVAER